ncbi:hypothetical protein AYL99_07243 [Fonsecaea erecta]|uniref:NADP-dependent oxidoreductase domain-containing protein n=1 Tax=Fonsecaea erecta TaxID=1367422 RepID=A0A178ZG36_9EURO|nr:hypothetical protein AYL99_07243 [Fonsecaea erecta]OAP58153.1 hypothetical protein AYL99_07243 [Fonsecaea erecta]
MSPTPEKPVKVVFGAMTFGRPGVEQARVNDLQVAGSMLDLFRSHGHNEIDTAQFYGLGSSEEYLGMLKWADRGLAMATKFYPTANIVDPNAPGGKGTTHCPEHLRENLLKSLKALQTEKIDLWYLHGPDRTTPYEVTLREVNNLHKEGYFTRFGISNYMSWEVAQICEICRRNGWIQPTVYQGLYNAIHRSVEQELFPCLRYYGISFYAYNPLAGGYLTDRYRRDIPNEEVEKGTRFDPTTFQGKAYRGRYWNDGAFEALRILREAIKGHDLTEAECAFRWSMHHSLLRGDKGDAIIIGASSIKQLEENLKCLEKGPLPESIVKAFNQGWERTRATSWKYWH